MTQDSDNAEGRTHFPPLTALPTVATPGATVAPLGQDGYDDADDDGDAAAQQPSPQTDVEGEGEDGDTSRPSHPMAPPQPAPVPPAHVPPAHVPPAVDGEDIVERLRRRADKARERYPDHAGDGATLVGGLIMDYEAAADEIDRLRAALKDLARKALAAMRP